jgi:hypothetical protein
MLQVAAPHTMAIGWLDGVLAAHDKGGPVIEVFPTLDKNHGRTYTFWIASD